MVIWSAAASAARRRLACVSAVQNQPLPWSAAASEARRRFGLCFCGTKPASAMECGGKRSATPLWLVFLRYKTSLCHGVRRQAKRDAALACVSAVQNQPLPWSAAASEARRRFGLCFCGTKPASAMECGGKRSATPLWLVFVSYPSQDQALEPKRRRASLAAALHGLPIRSEKGSTNLSCSSTITP